MKEELWIKAAAKDYVIYSSKASFSGLEMKCKDQHKELSFSHINLP